MNWEDKSFSESSGTEGEGNLMWWLSLLVYFGHVHRWDIETNLIRINTQTNINEISKSNHHNEDWEDQEVGNSSQSIWLQYKSIDGKFLVILCFYEKMSLRK